MKDPLLRIVIARLEHPAHAKVGLVHELDLRSIGHEGGRDRTHDGLMDEEGRAGEGERVESSDELRVEQLGDDAGEGDLERCLG